MSYTPPRGACSQKLSIMSTCPCHRFMVHPLKAATSFDCDGCGHHASFHQMENPAEEEAARRWKAQAAAEREEKDSNTPAPKRRRITNGGNSGGQQQKGLGGGGVVVEGIRKRQLMISDGSRKQRKTAAAAAAAREVFDEDWSADDLEEVEWSGAWKKDYQSH